MPPKKLAVDESKKQSDNFRNAARAFGCDEGLAHFDEVLKKVARHKLPHDVPPALKKPKTQRSVKP